MPERPIKMFSYDDGRSWRDPVVDTAHGPLRGQLVPLGGQELMLYGGSTIHFSQDGGKTWDETIEMPSTEGNARWHNKGSILVEGDTITAIGFQSGGSGSSLCRSYDRGRTWEKPIAVPQWIGCSEGAIVRAKDGALVAALRLGYQAEGLPNPNDHWRGIPTYRSTDNGNTWSQTQILNKYGHVHSELLLLNNGDILLTYAARIGELDGQTYHGIEAMLSHDNGKSWDWQNRFILFRCLSNDSMHSPISAQLSDGRILTVFMYHDPMRFCDDSLGIPGIGHVSAVIWSPE